MGTDYSPTAPSRIELFARVLIACRDHSLPVPASLSVHSADGASMFVDTEYEANEWAAFLGGSIKRDFYGWHLHVMVRGLPWAAVARNGIVDDAVSQFDSPAEPFAMPTPFLAVTPAPLACKVPYIQPRSEDGMFYEVITECVRSRSHLGDHADGAHQWKNDYNDTDFRTVTP